MAFKVGKVFKAAAGIASYAIPALGIASALIGAGRESRGARNEANAQRQMYEQQMANVRREQSQIQENISRNQNKVNAGIARANRGRIRGGLFGDSVGANNVGERLG